MRNKRLLWNTVSSLAQQVTTLLCGFILPRIILGHFGSEVNGLVVSVTQFLALISFLEMGVGAVVHSALYQPLADKDLKQVSRIMASAGKFFKRIGYILAGYIVVLCLVYPYVAQQNFGNLYTIGLILVLSISQFCQYFFGITDSLLITADQRGYVFYISQTLAVLLNTGISALLIYLGASIHAVKLATALIYLIRPVVVRLYIRRNYRIDRKITYTEEPIRQKWNGVAQHVAAVVLDGTDSVVLTVMASMADVSIYSAYNMVVLGVKQLFMSMTNGVQALMGELLAKNEKKELDDLFQWTQWSIHTGSVFVFGCTAVLVTTFVQVYTLGVEDADYVQPLFGLLLTIAHAGHCLRLPYNLVILAGGHYRQTQGNYIVAAVANIVVSVAMVHKWGLIGVAIGTLVAMLYQTVWMAWYVSRNLICYPFRGFLKQMAVNVGTFVVAYCITTPLEIHTLSYFGWFVLAVKVALVWLAVIALINLVFYHSKMRVLFRKLIRKQ